MRHIREEEVDEDAEETLAAMLYMNASEQLTQGSYIKSDKRYKRFKKSDAYHTMFVAGLIKGTKEYGSKPSHCSELGF